MQSDQAEARLRELLSAAGVNIEAPSSDDVERTWNVWRVFAAEPVEDAQPADEDGDGILAQYGTYGPAGEFTLDMTRQFTFADADGEYDHMSQLNCTFTFAADPALTAAGVESMWSFDTPLAEFFDDALASAGFTATRTLDARPLRLEIEYGEV